MRETVWFFICCILHILGKNGILFCKPQVFSCLTSSHVYMYSICPAYVYKSCKSDVFWTRERLPCPFRPAAWIRQSVIDLAWLLWRPLVWRCRNMTVSPGKHNTAFSSFTCVKMGCAVNLWKLLEFLVCSIFFQDRESCNYSFLHASGSHTVKKLHLQGFFQ